MRYSEEERREKIKQMIRKSNNTVAIMGTQAYVECGMRDYWCDQEAYRIEDEYHYSPEEILSTVFYNTRREQFYDYYKREIISTDYTPSETFYALKGLEDQGKMQACLTQNFQGMGRKVQLRTEVELHGSVHVNWCTRCGRHFGVDYLRNAAGIPVCDTCGANIRPGILLFGESIRNDVLTRAINALQNAELVLILGTTIYQLSNLFSSKLYKQAKVILISEEEHYMDRYADYTLYGEVKKILPSIVWEG